MKTTSEKVQYSVFAVSGYIINTFASLYSFASNTGVDVDEHGHRMNIPGPVIPDQWMQLAESRVKTNLLKFGSRKRKTDQSNKIMQRDPNRACRESAQRYSMVVINS